MQNFINLATLEFQTNVQMLLQQKDSRFEGAVMTGTNEGEGASPVSQVGLIEAEDIEDRYAPLNGGDAPLDRRWVYPGSSYFDRKFDKFDKLKVAMAGGIQSAVIQAGAAGMKRKRDRVILAGMFADAKTGKQGGTTTTFLAGNQVPVTTGGGGSDVGLNMAKIKAGLEILRGHDVDPEEQVYMATDSNQNAKLLNEIEAINSDYNKLGVVIVNGIVKRALGIEIIYSNLCSAKVDANLDVRCPMWVKSGVYLGTWDDLSVDISRRVDLTGQPWQVYSDQTIGATRLEEKKVVELILDPS